LFTFVYICLYLFTFVYICLHLFTFVYFCLLLFTFVYYCLLLFTIVYYCLLLFTIVYYCLLLFTIVYYCLLLFTIVYYCLQDEALSLVVTPKKRRHKVTDTRITPRTLSRVLGGEPLVDLHKHFPHFAAGLNGDSSPSGPGRQGMHPLFPGLPAPPGLFAGLPTSVAIPNPSLADFNPFRSFYSPPHLPVSSSNQATPSSAPGSAIREHHRPSPKMVTSSTPPLEKSRGVLPRERHHSSSDLGRDNALTPPSMLRGHASLLSRGSPDFAARLRDDRERDQDEFDRMNSMSYMSGK
jgi:hypothetical protein